MNIQTAIELIEDQRKQQNIHKNRLCGNSEISVQYYNKVLAGKASMSFDIIARLAQGIGFKVLFVPEQCLK